MDERKYCCTCMYFCECEGDSGDGMCDLTKEGKKYFMGCERYDDGSLPEGTVFPEDGED